MNRDENPWRILAIDDDESVHETYRNQLGINQKENRLEQQLQKLTTLPNKNINATPSPFTMDHAMNGEEGLHKVSSALDRGTPYAVIYLDMRMPPGWDGLKTAEKIRELDPTVRIILITAFTDYTLENIRERIGVDFAIISKPAQTTELLQLTTLLAHQWDQSMISRPTSAVLNLAPPPLQEDTNAERPIRILLVDDSPTVRAVYSNMLAQNRNYAVQTAGGMVEALRISKTFRPDLGILDFYMPDGNGAETARALLAQEENREALVVIFTQKSEVERIALEAGAMDVLYKDEPNEVFLQRIASFERYIRSQLELKATLHAHYQAETAAQQRLEQQARIQAEEALQSRNWMEAVLSSIPDGLLVIDQTQRIQQCNEAAATLLGYSEEALLQLQLNDLNFNHKGEHSYLIHSNGTQIPVALSHAPLVSTRNESVGDVIIFRDIRELLNAEQDRRANQAKSDFLAAMSHELRTPLTSIIGNCGLLNNEIYDNLNEEQQKILQSIEVAGRSQLALVNDILDLSKIEAGKFEVDQTNFDLDELLQDIEHIFSLRAQNAGLSFQIKRLYSLQHQLIGDGRRIGQILTNLLSNAIKFTNQGKIALDIEIDHTQSMICFAVRDEGIGIKTEELERLFQPFEQADQSISRRFGGTGLGLHISYTLAQLMDGTIRVESTFGAGSTFTLCIPFSPSSLPSTTTQASSTPSKNQPLDGHVLIAEDTPELQILEKKILNRLGLSVTLANNGAEAMEQAMTTPFDLILMDMQMPIMDGIEATRNLRSKGCTIPIIALTANVMQQHRTQFFEAGCNHFLSKPIDPQALQHCLQQFLNPKQVAENSTHHTPPESADELIDAEMYEVFLERLSTLHQELSSYHQQRDWPQIRNIAHTLKGSGSMFGHPQLTQQGKSICDAIDQCNFPPVSQMVEQLTHMTNEILNPSPPLQPSE